MYGASVSCRGGGLWNNFDHLDCLSCINFQPGMWNSETLNEWRTPDSPRCLATPAHRPHPQITAILQLSAGPMPPADAIPATPVTVDVQVGSMEIGELWQPC
ncbi:hypothetical protein V5799_008540 [Amblyomma americanum]|uniref:Uncharacterized protein n=1 Tax=Amblyomma americanum TaxID=6943 RepID=A0AAQ4FCP7_AMBAM